MDGLKTSSFVCKKWEAYLGVSNSKISPCSFKPSNVRKEMGRIRTFGTAATWLNIWRCIRSGAKKGREISFKQKNSKKKQLRANAAVFQGGRIFCGPTSTTREVSIISCLLFAQGNRAASRDYHWQHKNTKTKFTHKRSGRKGLDPVVDRYWSWVSSLLSLNAQIRPVFTLGATLKGLMELSKGKEGPNSVQALATTV